MVSGVDEVVDCGSGVLAYVDDGGEFGLVVVELVTLIGCVGCLCH